MKLILALPAVGLLFSGLTFIPKSSPQTFEASAPNARVETPQLWLDKSECSRGETFELHFAQPHATTLGVIDPDGKFFYLVFPAACTLGNLKPLVSSEDFEALSSLTINPATLLADPYTYGVLENKPVFTKSGVYKFILGDNLHVHDETELSTVALRYRHSVGQSSLTAI